MSKHQEDPAIAAVLELLAETFPKCFVIFEQRRWPLKVGIREDILAAIDGAMTPEELSAALGCYVGNAVYRSKLIAGADRIDLAGEPAGIVTPEQVPPPTLLRPQRSRKAAAPVKNQAESKLSAAADKPKKVPLELTVKGPQRLGLADLREAAKRRREFGKEA